MKFSTRYFIICNYTQRLLSSGIFRTPPPRSSDLEIQKLSNAKYRLNPSLHCSRYTHLFRTSFEFRSTSIGRLHCKIHSETQASGESISIMGGVHSSNDNQSSRDAHGASPASKEIKICYYELLGVDSLASDEEYAISEVIEHILLTNSEGSRRLIAKKLWNFTRIAILEM